VSNLTITFSKLIDALQRHYGPPVPPPSTDPLELIIWENIAYLANDERRAEAFAKLKQGIGTSPEEILAAKHSSLAAVGKGGILPDVSAEKLLTIARIAYQEFDSDLHSVLKKPLAQAKKGLKKFPGIGDPGAEKILLFTHFLSSDGARVERAASALPGWLYRRAGELFDNLPVASGRFARTAPSRLRLVDSRTSITAATWTGIV
jgi:hypothetical protein